VWAPAVSERRSRVRSRANANATDLDHQHQQQQQPCHHHRQAPQHLDPRPTHHYVYQVPQIGIIYSLPIAYTSLTSSSSSSTPTSTELYFLIAHFLESGPCKQAADVLKAELHQHGLLPRTYTCPWRGEWRAATFDEAVRTHSLPLDHCVTHVARSLAHSRTGEHRRVRSRKYRMPICHSCWRVYWP